MEINDDVKEEINVIFHASLLGRTDVLKNAIAAIKATGRYSTEEIVQLISLTRSEDGATPLHVATQHGHSDVIRALLNAGADVSLCSESGEFAGKRPYDLSTNTAKQTFHVFLFEQIAMGNAETIQRLINGGIAVDLRDDSALEDTTLHWACSFGHLEVAKLLILNGIDIAITNSEGMTPLHIAAKNNFVEVTRLLLEEGAVVDALDHQQQTALSLTSSSAVTQLLENPPEPSRTLRNAFLEKQAALLLKQQSEEATPKVSDLDEEQQKVTSSAQERFDDFEDPNLEGGFRCAETKDHEEDGVLLVFWPPVLTQQRQPGRFLALNNEENLYIALSAAQNISSDAHQQPDILSLLSHSGLLDTLDEMGFQVQVKRTAKQAKLRLTIDNNLCPAKHSYQIVVTENSIVLTAGDATGLLYALYTFQQLLQLHSTVKTETVPHQTTTSQPQQRLHIPVILIEDRPSLSTRSVLWSFRHDAQHTLAQMHSYVALCSKLRLSRLYCIVDCDGEGTDDEEDGVVALEENEQTVTKELESPPAIPINPVLTSQNNHDDNHPTYNHTEETAAKLCALDALCRGLCVELVPTVVLSSLSDSLPSETLRNFSHSLINVVLLLDEAQAQRDLEVVLAQQQLSQSSTDLNNSSTINHNHTDNSAHIDNHHNLPVITLGDYCNLLCQQLLREIQSAGFRTVQWSCSRWFGQLAPARVHAASLGISLVECSLSHLYPAKLFMKPLVATQHYLGHLAHYVDAVESARLNQVVLPAFSEVHSVYPALLLKFILVVFAGFAWNKSITIDMLGDPAYTGDAADPAATQSSSTPSSSSANSSTYDATVLREVLRCLLYPTLRHAIRLASQQQQSSVTVASKQAIEHLYSLRQALHTALGLFTVDWRAICNKLQLEASSTTASSTPSTTSLPSSSPPVDATTNSPHKHPTSSATTSSTNVACSEDPWGLSSIAKAEEALWTLLILPAHPSQTSSEGDLVDTQRCALPTRLQASQLLKTYRRVLSAAQWSPPPRESLFALPTAAPSAIPSSSTAAHSTVSHPVGQRHTPAPSSATGSFLDFFLGRQPSPAPATSASTASTTVAAVGTDGALANAPTNRNRMYIHTTNSSSAYGAFGSLPSTPVSASYAANYHQTHVATAQYQHNNSSSLTPATLWQQPQLQSDLDEFFATLLLLSQLCKLSLQAANAHQRAQQQQVPSLGSDGHASSSHNKTGSSHGASNNTSDISSAVIFQEVLRALPVGARSDAANTLLESLHCLGGAVWRTRFDANFFAALRRHSSLMTTSTSGTAEGGIVHSPHMSGSSPAAVSAEDRERLRVSLHGAFLRPTQVHLPAAQILQVLCAELPSSEAVDAFLQRVFA